MEIATLTRENDRTRIRILRQPEVEKLIKIFEDEEAEKAEQAKREKAAKSAAEASKS